MVSLSRLVAICVALGFAVAFGGSASAAVDTLVSPAISTSVNKERFGERVSSTPHDPSSPLLPTMASTPVPASIVQATTPISSPTAVSVEEGIPLRVVAPSIHLDAPVVPVGWKHVVQDGKVVGMWEVADYAAGWHKSSALPGQPGNTVLSGHHNTAGEVFRYVVDLQPGDPVFLYTEQHVYTYTVVSRFILRDKGMPASVRRENARWIGTFPDVRLTLVTCWPYHTNTHRVIVIAKYDG
ncbi:MAG: hypothetical protein DDG58_12175 [Ardenticatenia bacterium]|nr:MAG: hypothetical protein DDG58_12175 [Ardenticatenia bacterium]